MDRAHASRPHARLAVLALLALPAAPAAARQYFNPRIVSTTFGPAPAVAVGDINNDSRRDVVAVDTATHELAWFQNDFSAIPSFTERVISTNFTSPVALAVANIGGNGALDVVVASSGDNRVVWFESSGGQNPTWTERVVSTSTAGAAAVVVRDLDNDGDADLVVAAPGANAIYWFDSNGEVPPVFTRRTVSSMAVGCSSVAALDLNGDTRADIVGYNSAENALLWFENVPGAPATFTQRVIGGAPTANGRVWAQDLNADTFADVVLATPTGLRWFQNMGGAAPNFTPHLFTFNLAAPSDVTAGDVNGDTKIDVVVCYDAGKGIAWYENDGGLVPGFPEHVIESGARRFSSVRIADLNNDNDADLALGALEGATLPWYEQGDPDLHVDWHTIDGGGGVSTNSADGVAYTVQGTIGQPDAAASAGGGFELRGGFWLTPLFAPCPGDTNGDRMVDFLDLNNVLSDFGQSGPNLVGDVNHNGVCDFIDLNIILGAFGTSC